MSAFDGYEDEMLNRQPSDEQAEAMIRGEDPGDPALTETGDALRSLRALGDHAVADDVAERHIAMIARAASLSSRPAPVAEPKRTRRRIVLSTVLSSLLAKILAATVAVAAVGTGVGVTADAAAPGEALYALDRAMESVSLADGGAAERVEEARALLDLDLPAAVETAAEAAENDEDEETPSGAAEALRAAAARISTADGEQSALTREQVSALLEQIASQLESGEGVDGESIAETARAIRPEVELPDEADHGDVPPVSVPEDVPPVTTGPGEQEPPVDTPPVDAPPASTPPVDTPPVDTP